MLPSPQPPSLRSAKGSKELNGEVRTGEQTKTETRLVKSTSHVNIEARAQPGPAQPRYWLKVTTMTEKERYNLCRQQQVTTITSQLSFTWLTRSSAANLTLSRRPQLFGGWGPALAGGKGRMQWGLSFGFFLLLFSSVSLHWQRDGFG